jgi:hypothetical protein
MGWPRTTASPARTKSSETHEYVDDTLNPWSMVRKSDPATGPANVTLPGAGAWTAVPKGVAMSIPRCPAPYGDAGGSNGRITGPITGQDQSIAAPAVCVARPISESTIRSTAIRRMWSTVGTSTDEDRDADHRTSAIAGISRPRRAARAARIPPSCGSDRCATR